MNTLDWTLFFILAITSSSHQYPTFFKKSFKQLNGIIPIIRVPDSDEIKAVYYHDQTVAAVDLGYDNELHNCQLIEVYEPEEAKEVLRNLTSITIPQLVTFQEMTKLMQQCELLDRILHEELSVSSSNTVNKNNRGVGSVLSLFSGILPGTKWCGTGDIAENYRDLGPEDQIDRCCRSHDLCPVKVRAQQTRYNLTNYSIYTKSHCVCDEALYQCLKATTHPTAQIMGRIYFNVFKIPCIEDVPASGSNSIDVERRFTPVKKHF